MEFQSISQLKLLLDDNKISVKEIAQTYIKKIKEKKDLNIFIYFNEDKIYDQVKLIEKISNDNSLKGIPIAVKDLFCTKNMPTTAGSKILENFNPTYESFVTQKLINQGSMFVGKTNLDEFAMGSATNTSYFGDTINPLSNEGSPLAPGGSSGGSAAAVAADLCLGAIGTDTGGSIRQPASFCGVVGIKPTYGICSRWGIAAFASSLDQAGIFSKNVTDLLMDINYGYILVCYILYFQNMKSRRTKCENQYYFAYFVTEKIFFIHLLKEEVLQKIS